MNIRYLQIWFVLIIFYSAVSCDTRKKKSIIDDPLFQLLCFSNNYCQEPPRGTKFGLIGDSWTDMIGGVPLIWSIRTYMEDKYGYRMTASTIAGRKLSDVMDEGLHYNIIDKAGPDLRYMILSLGGNDLLLNYPVYSANLAGEKQAIMALIRTRLLTVVRSGNIYKKEKWGGSDLIWIIHGYDYINPDKVLSVIEGCRPLFRKYGYPDSVIIPDLIDSMDRLNQVMLEATYEEPSLRYVNLRGTLGGPPVSNPDHLFDCLHPNSAGFNIVTSVFVNNLDYITGHAR